MTDKTMSMYRRIAVAFAISALLQGCASLNMYDLTDQFAFMHSFKSAKDDFDRGRVMEARSEILSLDKKRADYNKAMAFLRDKIEPARLHLLNYYTDKAAKAEKNGDWFTAMGMYEQAAGFSTSPEDLLRKEREMSLKMRQVRLNALLRQRRREDAAILSWQNSYESPKGVDINDPAFRRDRQNYSELLDSRASNAYSGAKRYLRDDMPGVAYVEIESYLRYEPDSKSGKKLMADIRKEMPKGLQITSIKHFNQTTPTSIAPMVPQVRQPEPTTVDIGDIRKQMQERHWLQARQLASTYRREGGEDAVSLFEYVESQIAVEAAAAFQRGSLAFRKEDIDGAVKQWSIAAKLMPNVPDYVDSLRRAKLLQERLRILRQSESVQKKTGSTVPVGK